MLNRLRGLFHRYADQNLHLEAGGFALGVDGGADGGQGAPEGYIDRVTLQGNRVSVSGWTTADTVTLH